MFRRVLAVVVLSIACLSAPAFAQEQSVKPGINDSFRNPDVDDFVGKFEIESREVFARRKEIVAACEIQPGQTVADIGAGCNTQPPHQGSGFVAQDIAIQIRGDDHIIALGFENHAVDH